MSSIKFDNLSEERPDLAEAASLVKSWMARHPSTSAVDPIRIIRETRTDSAPYVAEVFKELEERGEVESTFRMRSPDGVLIAGELDSPTHLPEFVEDAAGDRYATDQCEVVLVFRAAAGGSR